MANPGLFFVYFRSFQSQVLQKKTVSVRGTRTRIVRVEGTLTTWPLPRPKKIILYLLLVCEKNENKQIEAGFGS